MNAQMKSITRVIALFVIIMFVSSAASAQVTLTINKSNSAPNPVQSGVPFTYTIGYSWSGGVPAGGTLVIQDILPPGLDALPPYTNYPSSTTFNGVTNTVTYTQTGIVTTAGSGVLLVYAAFKIGVTCNGTQICDTARIQEPQVPNPKWVYSNSSCATASALNNWTFKNELYAGCAATCTPGPTNDVIFRVDIFNFAGYYGGLNLTNLSLNYSFPLASGAVITGVTTWGPSSPVVGTLPNDPTGWYVPGGFGSNAITVKGDLTPPLVLSVYNYWVTLYIHVNFPCNQTGNTIISTADLSYNTPCDTLKPLHFTDTAKVTICQAVQKGSLYKDFEVITYDPYNPWYFPNTITPGCCGTYRIGYTNTGTVAQAGVIVTDTVPGAMDVSQIYTDISGGTPVKEEVWTYPSGPWTVVQAARLVSGYDALSPSLLPIGKIRWTYSGSMAIAASLTNTIDVCVRTTNFRTGATVVASQSIIDTASVTDAFGLSNMTTNLLTVSVTSPHLIAEKAFIGTCDNTGPHPGGPWFPGDIVRFRMAVANTGSAAATPVTITDLLPAGFSYQGNETYYYGTINPPGNWVSAYAPPCDSLTASVPIQIGALTKPIIGTTGLANLVWKFPTLPSRCDGTPDYLIIEFDVKIIDTPIATLPGTYANNFTISATNATSATSNNAYVVVSSRPGLVAKKEVRSSPLGTFGPSATIIAGGTGEYRLTVKNTGNVPLANICILDILPHIGDIGVLPPYAPRNSQFNVVLTSPVTITTPLTGFTAGYYNNSPNPSATGNPSRLNACGGFCITADPSGATLTGTYGATVPGGGTYSFKVSANTLINLPPGGVLQVIVPFTVPATAPVGDTACNSFAYQCSPLGSTTCLAAEPVDVCIKVVKDTGTSGGCCPCDTLSMAPTNLYDNIQTQWKTITIYNLHCSPIDSINLRYYDCSTGLLIPQINLLALNGGNLHIYRNPSINVTQPYSMFNASNRYQHMPLPVNTLLPAYGSPLTQDRVSFDLGLNYFLIPPSWCLHVIIYHANGDSCVDTLPRWTPTPPNGGTGIGNGTFDGTVFAVPVTVDPTKFESGKLGFATATVSDSNDMILGGSGGIWESQTDSVGYTARPLTFVQNKRTALFHLSHDSAGAKTVLPLYVFIVHKGDTAKKPRITIGLFDNESNLISTDTVQASKIASRVGPQPGIAPPSNDMQITSIKPNPARSSIEVQYTLGSSDMARLEMFNTLGVRVGVLTDSYQTQGEHTANFIVAALPEGSYYLRLSTQSGQTTASVRIIH